MSKRIFLYFIIVCFLFGCGYGNKPNSNYSSNTNKKLYNKITQKFKNYNDDLLRICAGNLRCIVSYDYYECSDTTGGSYIKFYKNNKPFVWMPLNDCALVDEQVEVFYSSFKDDYFMIFTLELPYTTDTSPMLVAHISNDTVAFFQIDYLFDKALEEKMSIDEFWEHNYHEVELINDSLRITMIQDKYNIRIRYNFIEQISNIHLSKYCLSKLDEREGKNIRE